MPRLYLRVFVAIAFSLLLSAVAESAGPEARKLFGQGVHSLYQGRLFEAIENFDIASIDLPQDPRIYYFRGVAKMRIGQTGDAIFDFQRGAQFEALLGRRDIGRSLQRIQGYERIQIERYRLAARKLAIAGELLPPDAIVIRQAPSQLSPANRVVVAEIPAEEELPVDANDPFSASSDGLLGRGSTAQPADVAAPPQPQLNNDAEVAADAFAEEFPDEDAEENPFPIDPELGDEPTASATDSGTSGGGAFGAVFRAFSRSAIPGTAEQRDSLIEGIRETVPMPNAGPQQSGNDVPGQPGDDEDPFGSDSDPFGDGAEMSDLEDPVGSGTQADDSNGQDSTDDSDDTDSDDTDPFADEEDPFADEEDPFGN